MRNVKTALALALPMLEAGRVIVYPTDTLYGIGGDATRKDVCERIARIKGRKKGMSFSVLFADWAQAARYVKVSPALRARLEELTPGPYTFLLEAKKPLPVSQTGLIGCRIPDHALDLRMAAAFGKPVVTTSANRTGQPPAHRLADLDPRVAEQVGLIVDGGRCKQAKGSTIIDVQKRQIVREGAGLMRAKKWLKSLKKTDTWKRRA